MEHSETWWVFPGFEIELVATGLALPVNLAFVPESSGESSAPLVYVTELYGQIKVITNDWTVHTYAEGLLNYEPDFKFPGTGESGVIGVCVEPSTGDVFASMVYDDAGATKSKVVRMSSADGGLSAASARTVIDDIPAIRAAHQVQAVSIGFDGKLYVNLGDGMIDPNVAQDDSDLRGKILRLELDGSVPGDNPAPGSPVFAKGLRNPFGACWRRKDEALYVSDNGPTFDDRILRAEAGVNYGWPATLRANTIFWWGFTQAPTALAFAGGDEFPEDFRDDLFVALFGGAYVMGEAVKGKKIVKMTLNEDLSGVASYDSFIFYTGDGPASPCGLAFGPGGLYFTDLFGEPTDSPEAPAGNIYRIKSRV